MRCVAAAREVRVRERVARLARESRSPLTRSPAQAVAVVVVVVADAVPSLSLPALALPFPDSDSRSVSPLPSFPEVCVCACACARVCAGNFLFAPLLSLPLTLCSDREASPAAHKKQAADQCALIRRAQQDRRDSSAGLAVRTSGHCKATHCKQLRRRHGGQSGGDDDGSGSRNVPDAVNGRGRRVPVSGVT